MKRRKQTIAYFSLLNDKIEREITDNAAWNRLAREIPNIKRRKSQPAVKIGRLKDKVGGHESLASWNSGSLKKIGDNIAVVQQGKISDVCHPDGRNDPAQVSSRVHCEIFRYAQNDTRRPWTTAMLLPFFIHLTLSLDLRPTPGCRS